MVVTKARDGLRFARLQERRRGWRCVSAYLQRRTFSCVGIAWKPPWMQCRKTPCQRWRKSEGAETQETPRIGKDIILPPFPVVRLMGTLSRAMSGRSESLSVLSSLRDPVHSSFRGQHRNRLEVRLHRNNGPPGCRGSSLPRSFERGQT